MKPVPGRRFSGVVALLALLACISAAAAAPASAHGAVEAAPRDRAHHKATKAPSLSETSGLSISIDDVAPAVLHEGQKVRVTGSVTSLADFTWVRPQVYLTMSLEPAASKGTLDDFALTGDDTFGDTVFEIGYFDVLDDIPPGGRADYSLKVPYAHLPQITGGTGVYHLGVSVLATDADGVRDSNAEARADTLLPLVDADSISQPTRVVTLLPFTAPVARRADGSFVDDRLAADVSLGGRLRNLLDFVEQAPADSLELAVDPALLDALTAMADGYQVRPLTGTGEPVDPVDGQGRLEASTWLSDFNTVRGQQSVVLLPWANPDSSALAEARVPGVVETAVQASRRYALDNTFPSTVVDWQNNGASSRRGLSIAARAGANPHVVSQDTLTRLQPTDENGYPPALASVATTNGPLTTVVSRSEVAGTALASSTTALELRQDLLAEATIRALTPGESPTSVIALPFHWDPGPQAGALDLDGAFGSPVLQPTSLADLANDVPTPYSGPVQITTDPPGLDPEVLAALERLRTVGRVYTELLTDNKAASDTFDQQLAVAGSSVWEWQPRRGEALIRGTARSMAGQLAKVTVTGPEFVALSSQQGQFPLTVTNGLDVSITVTLDVKPLNPALEFEAIDPIVLDPGQRQDIEVVSRADGSGVTAVRARLSTSGDRAFGAPWDFDIRATKIGLAIWILLGVLGAALFSSAVVRIVRRARAGGFTPRGEQEG